MNIEDLKKEIDKRIDKRKGISDECLTEIFDLINKANLNDSQKEELCGYLTSLQEQIDKENYDRLIANLEGHRQWIDIQEEEKNRYLYRKQKTEFIKSICYSTIKIYFGVLAILGIIGFIFVKKNADWWIDALAYAATMWMPIVWIEEKILRIYYHLDLKWNLLFFEEDPDDFYKNYQFRKLSDQ